MSNRAVSIRARLLNLAKKEGIDFQLIIIRFLHERLLYRLSVSDYSEQLILKGGAFIYAMQGLKSRPTIDVDLLGTQISNDIEILCEVFRQICAVESEDEVSFIPESVVGELITQQDKYNGVRLYIDATFHTVRQRIQIDVGFGDIVIPVVQKLEYPILLDEMQVPVIQAYSKETVIAEKFQAMIELSVANSRMKDFYDVYKILTDNKFDNDTLEEAIKATFANRGTSYTENHALFSSDFATNALRKRNWTAFLNKINKDKELKFEEVMQLISEKLLPYWSKMRLRLLALLRGINVGGNNIIKMAALKACFEAMGFKNVVTYIQSGNVLFDAEDANTKLLTTVIEQRLSEQFAYASRIVLITREKLLRVIQQAPDGFGVYPETYRYDVIFLRQPVSAAEALSKIKTKEGVDFVKPGEGVLYFSRLSSKSSQSHMTKMIGTAIYKEMTIRNWNTTTRLAEL